MGGFGQLGEVAGRLGSRAQRGTVVVVGAVVVVGTVVVVVVVVVVGLGPGLHTAAGAGIAGSEEHGGYVHGGTPSLRAEIK